MVERVPMVLINLPKKVGIQAPFPSWSRFGTTPEFELAGEDDEGPGASAQGQEMVQQSQPEASVERVDMTPGEIDEARNSGSTLPIFDMPITLPGGFPGATPFAAGAAPAPSGTTASWGIEAVGATGVPETAGADIVVAVLDTGIRRSHAAFADIPKVETRNFTTSQLSEDVTDNLGHGTHVAGTIFGRDVDGVRIGVARGVNRVMIGKVMEKNVTCTTNMILQAIFWALGGGASIINLSLGIDFPGYVASLEREGHKPEAAASVALSRYRENIRAFDALSNAVTMGMPGFFRGLLVAASGNQSRRPDYAVTCAPPASGQSFFSVAAVDQQRTVWSGSNQDVTISGPGVDIVSASHLDDRGLVTRYGTSMAAPHVSGVGVLNCEALQAIAGFGPDVLRRRLEDTALPLAGETRDVGRGLVNWKPV